MKCVTRSTNAFECAKGRCIARHVAFQHGNSTIGCTKDREENGEGDVKEGEGKGEKSEHLTDWYRRRESRNAPPLDLVESLDLGNGDEAVVQNKQFHTCQLTRNLSRARLQERMRRARAATYMTIALRPPLTSISWADEIWRGLNSALRSATAPSSSTRAWPTCSSISEGGVRGALADLRIFAEADMLNKSV